MKTMSQVYIRLNENLFKCKKYDLNFLITKVLIERIDAFPDIYIEEIAYAAKTTPASITKFCKKIGYSSFKEMRNDLENYFAKEYEVAQMMNEGMLSTIDREGSIQEMTASFLAKEYMIQKNIFQTFDSPQCMAIADMLKNVKRIAILGNSYSFSGVNLFRELLSQEGYIVFEVNRNAEDQLIHQALDEADACFIINLTGSWVDKKHELLEPLPCKKFLLTFSNQMKPLRLFDEVIMFKEILPMMSSNYYSQKVIHLWIILLTMNIKKK